MFSAGIDGFGEALGDAWTPTPQAIERTTSAALDLVRDRVDVLPLALADRGRVLDLDLAAVGLRLDAQLGREDLDLLLAAREADSDAGVAAGEEDLLRASTSSGISSRGLCSAVIIRRAPSR